MFASCSGQSGVCAGAGLQMCCAVCSSRAAALNASTIVLAASGKVGTAEVPPPHSASAPAPPDLRSWRGFGAPGERRVMQGTAEEFYMSARQPVPQGGAVELVLVATHGRKFCNWTPRPAHLSMIRAEGLPAVK